MTDELAEQLERVDKLCRAEKGPWARTAAEAIQELTARYEELAKRVEKLEQPKKPRRKHKVCGIVEPITPAQAAYMKQWKQE